jgi:hypothetical protein
VKVGRLINQRRTGGNETVARDFLAPHHAFEKEGIVVAAQHLECRHGREMVGEQLPVNRHNVRVLSRGGKRRKIGKVPPHLWHSKEIMADVEAIG